MCKFLRIVICFLICFNEIYSFPVSYDPMFVPISVLQPNTFSINQNRPKQVWNVIGNLISSSGFLPIEINVPDTVGAIYNGAQNVYNGISMGISSVAGNVIQRIPLLQQLTGANNPRPLKRPIIVLLPYEMVAGNHGNQFGANENVQVMNPEYANE